MIFWSVLSVFFFCVVFLFLILVMGSFFLDFTNSKSTGFECGFSSFLYCGFSFSFPFFVVCLMFLLFDVELVILSFPCFLGFGFSFLYWFIVILIFLATCYEWLIGVLEWVSSAW